MPTPIVRLLPMDEAHFPAYRDYFIDDYARDLASNHGLTQTEARQQAEASLRQYLPQGRPPGQSLLCIIPVNDTVHDNVGGAVAPIAGYLWHSTTAPPTAPLSMTSTHPAHRGLGWAARPPWRCWEAELKCLGVSQIKLRVAYDNPRARALYEEIGFHITGYNMAKTLG